MEMYNGKGMDVDVFIGLGGLGDVAQSQWHAASSSLEMFMLIKFKLQLNIKLNQKLHSQVTCSSKPPITTNISPSWSESSAPSPTRNSTSRRTTPSSARSSADTAANPVMSKAKIPDLQVPAGFIHRQVLLTHY